MNTLILIFSVEIPLTIGALDGCVVFAIFAELGSRTLAVDAVQFDGRKLGHSRDFDSGVF